MRTVRVTFTEGQINRLLDLTSKELLRQITHHCIDEVTGEATMRIVRAKERFMPERKEKDGN